MNTVCQNVLKGHKNISLRVMIHLNWNYQRSKHNIFYNIGKFQLKIK